MKFDKKIQSVLSYIAKIQPTFEINQGNRIAVISTSANAFVRAFMPYEIEIDNTIRVYNGDAFCMMAQSIGEPEITAMPTYCTMKNNTGISGRFAYCTAELIPEVPETDLVDDGQFSFVMSAEFYSALVKSARTIKATHLHFVVESADKAVINVINPAYAGANQLTVDMVAVGLELTQIGSGSIDFVCEVNELVLYPAKNYNVVLSNEGLLTVETVTDASTGDDVSVLLSLATKGLSEC